MLKNKKSNSLEQRSSSALKRAKKSIFAQALLAALMVFLTVIIVFAITAAWYTNVVQTGGLVFEAEAWGFEGTLDLGTGEVIKAAPGDEGVIPLLAKNNSNSVAAVSVNINKSDMPEEMQKRIYFYVDTPKVQNEETMDRIYLNNSENYTYTMFGQGTLRLGETVYNDSRIKWHWVYDVLGYYVLGSWDAENDSFSVEEYLRPIEYDYDEATTVFETDHNGDLAGEVVSIDGMMPEDFLRSVSETDGYLGFIDAEDSLDGYYMVDVDESGYGVWAYLCTYSEIMENTRYDTALGESVTQEEYRAVISFSAQNSAADIVSVHTAEGLEQALSTGASASEPVFVQLDSDIKMQNALSLMNADKVMLDLNGYDLQLACGTYADKAAGVELAPGSSLTVINGSLSDADDAGIAMFVSGAELAMSNVSITDIECALYVRDEWNANTIDSVIRLVGCSFNTTEEAIYFSGNGDTSVQCSKLFVEDCVIRSGYAGIMGNGSGDRAGTDIQIIHSDIQGFYTGIYNPQDNSTLTISGESTISGYTGLVLKGGVTEIIESAVRGTGEEIPPTEMLASGFNDTGDGIYIETNYGHEIVLRISGASSVESVYGEALRVFEETADNVYIEIVSAYINGELVFSDNIEPAYSPEVFVASEADSLQENDVTEEDPRETNADRQILTSSVSNDGVLTSETDVPSEETEEPVQTEITADAGLIETAEEPNNE